MTSIQPRKPQGVPTGGQFAGKRLPAPGYSLDAGDDPDTGRACSECGTLTKRSSGLCKRCDPSSKANRVGAGSKTAPAGRGPGVRYDTSAGSVPVDKIVQCGFETVPAYRSSGLTGGFRQCANAVIAPAAFCHRHGGTKEMSLCRTVAKATAEAGRGECWPVAAEHWESSDARLEAAEGALAEMLASDTSAMAAMMVEFRRAHRTSSVGRMSPGNQMLILSQHYRDAKNEEVGDTEALDEAIRRASEPHMTASNWAKAGRAPLDGETPVAAIWLAPGRTPARKDGETDEEYVARAEKARRWRHGAVAEYRLSQTDGEAYEMPPDPIGSFRPAGHGDPEAAIATMTGLASDMGVTVEMTDRQPADGAYAYWKASENKIVVWTKVADGDRRAVAHSLAHELGHARLGHSTSEDTEVVRVEKETAAEAFAALTCAHHGVDTAALSAHYISDWRGAQHIDMRGTPTKALRHAVECFDEYVTATTPAETVGAAA